jgi:site-specific DNA-cytosine methylase
MMTIGDLEQAKYHSSKRPPYKDVNKLFPTPTKQDYKRRGPNSKQKGLSNTELFATPTTQDASNNGGRSQHDRNSLPLNAQIGGKLNPDWVEQLMGFPLCWTDLEQNEVGTENRFPETWADDSWEEGIPRVTQRKIGRVDRLKQLGNAVVPQIPEFIGRAIMQIEGF